MAKSVFFVLVLAIPGEAGDLTTLSEKTMNALWDFRVVTGQPYSGEASLKANLEALQVWLKAKNPNPRAGRHILSNILHHLDAMQDRLRKLESWRRT